MATIELCILLGVLIVFLVTFSVYVAFKCYKKKERKFECYSDLPPEMRLAIINRMDTVTRTAFRECSKMSNAQVKESENYIDKLKLLLSPAKLIITIQYCDLFLEKPYEFHLVFKNRKDNKCIIW